jgi:hypothetical protein
MQSDLRVSQLSSNLQYKSHFSSHNDENANINSNLSSVHQHYQHMQQSNANQLKMTSSLLVQSDLVQSSTNQYPLQVNLLQNSSNISNPVLQQSSLQYLSYLSDNIKSQARRDDDNISMRYGAQNSDGYKLRLKELMNR